MLIQTAEYIPGWLVRVALSLPPLKAGICVVREKLFTLLEVTLKRKLSTTVDADHSDRYQTRFTE